MKYLKLFESKYKKEIWMVPTKEPNYTIAMRKIGASEEIIHEFKFLIRRNENYQLLHYRDFHSGGKNASDNWTYSSVDSKYSSGDFFNDKRYIDSPLFMGKVEVTDEDMERYYAGEEANKYNL